MEENKVVQFLLSTPDFFLRHAKTLNQITLPNPHGNRAVSLAEWQVQLLREKNKLLENKIKEFLYFGHQNDRLIRLLTQWCAFVISNSNERELPTLLAKKLASIFNISYTKVFLFPFKNKEEKHLSDNNSAPQFVKSLHSFVKNLNRPYCNNEANEGEIDWLFKKNELMSHLSSIALLPLIKKEPENIQADLAQKNIKKTALFLNSFDGLLSHQHFGVLILGDVNKDRFQKESHTDFLEQIAILSSTALSRYSNLF